MRKFLKWAKVFCCLLVSFCTQYTKKYNIFPRLFRNINIISWKGSCIIGFLCTSCQTFITDNQINPYRGAKLLNTILRLPFHFTVSFHLVLYHTYATWPEEISLENKRCFILPTLSFCFWQLQNQIPVFLSYWANYRTIQTTSWGKAHQWGRHLVFFHYTDLSLLI